VWESFSHGGRAIYGEAILAPIWLPDGVRVRWGGSEVQAAFVTSLNGYPKAFLDAINSSQLNLQYEVAIHDSFATLKRRRSRVTSLFRSRFWIPSWGCEAGF